MQRLLKIACLGYVVFLTLLLLTANPAKTIGLCGALPWFLRALMPSAHLLSFLVLAMLAFLVRWPVPRWGIVLILAIYGGMTEMLQSLVPPRTPELMDWLQDMGGLAVGGGACWLIASLLSKESLARYPHALARIFAVLQTANQNVLRSWRLARRSLVGTTAIAPRQLRKSAMGYPLAKGRSMPNSGATSV